jgi:hypothetical protein
MRKAEAAPKVLHFRNGDQKNLWMKRKEWHREYSSEVSSR